MADRYWVGGTATWDATAGTKWAATSGGAGGQTVPTAADNVFFDVSSGANTVTISGTRPCLSLNATGFTGTLAGTATPLLQINASLTLASGMTIDGTLTTVTFVGNTATRTLTSAGKSLINVSVATTSTNTLTLQDNLTVTTNFTLTTGVLALDTRTLTTATFTNTSTSTRTLNFGTGKLVLTGSGTVFNGVITGFTTSGTTKIVEPSLGAAQTITPGALTEANSFDISVPATAGNFTLTLTAGGYHNLTFADATYTVANTALSVYGSLTISGTSPTFTAGTNAWTFAAASSTETITTSGETLDFPITFNGANGIWQLQDALTVASGRTVTLTDGTLDLQSYTFTTGLFSSSNSNTRTIAFGTGKIVLTGTGGVWSTSTATSLTITGTNRIVEPALGAAQQISPGSPTEANTFDVSVPATAGNFTLTLNTGNFRNLSFANATYTVTSGGALNVFGNLLVSGTSPTFTATTNIWTFAATGSTVQTITTNGETLDFPITKGGSTTSTLQLQDALSLGLTRTFTLTSGILDLQSFTMTLGLFSSSGSSVRSIAFGTGKILLSGTAAATAWTTATATNFTSSGSKRVEVTAPIGGATKVVNFGAITEANTLDVFVISGGSTGTINLAGSVHDVSFANDSYTILNNAVSIYGNFLISGTSPTFDVGSNTYSFVATSGTQTITTNGETLDFPITVGATGGTVQLEDALTLGTTRTFTFTTGTLNLQSYTLTAGTFSSNNSNSRILNFGTGKIVLTQTGGATQPMNMTTSTNFVSSGTRLVEAVTGGSGTRTYAFGTGVTEANTLNLSIVLGGTTGGTFLVTGRINNFNVDNVACAMDVAFAPSVYGDFFIGGTSVAWNSGGTATTTFAATSGTKNITTNGVTMQCGVNFNGIGGTWQLQSALTIGTAHRMTLTAGAVDLNDYSCSVGSYTLATNSNVKSIDFGTSEIFITDSLGWPINSNVALNIQSTSYTNYSVSGLNQFALSPGASEIKVATQGAFENLVPNLRVVSANIVLADDLSIKDLILSGSGTIRPSTQSNRELFIYGNLLAEATWTGDFGATGDPSFNPPFYYNKLSFKSTTGVKTITSNGKTINALMFFDSATGSWRFDDNFQQSTQSDPGNFERYMRLVLGSIDFNGKTVTVNSFQKLFSSSTTAITFNGGTLSIIGTDYTYPNPGSSWGPCYIDGDNLTLTSDTGTIQFSSTGATTFLGGGTGAFGDVSYPKIRSNGTTGLTIKTINAKLTITDLVPHPSQNSYFYFVNGSTTYFENFTLTPGVGNRAYLESTSPGSAYSFILNSGIANCQRLNIKDSNASPSTNTWYAGSTSVNVSGNTGWIFADAPQASGNMLMLFV
jgi:hypothetical protein